MAMSAGVCGKRVCFEEIFGFSSAAKRSRISSFGSGFEDKISILIQMFPALNYELVESVLKTHNNKIEDAIENLRSLTVGDISAKNELQSLHSRISADCASIPGGGPPLQQDAEDAKFMRSTFDLGNPRDGSDWVDAFVKEMVNAIDRDDAKGRTARFLEAFERNIVAYSRASEELEHASLKENLQTLLRDNQILKRAVSIQHDRNLELEEKAREVQQLKHVISQYQDQVRSLELNNYTLKLHLQRAQESRTICQRFNPDIF